MAFNPTESRVRKIIAALIEQFPDIAKFYDNPEYRLLDRFDWGKDSDTHAIYWDMDYEMQNSILDKFVSPFEGKLFLESINSGMIGVYRV